MDIRNISISLRSKLKVMKKVLLLLLVTLSTLCGYSQDAKQLITSTLNGNLKESQFCKNGYYFITVDTVLEKNIVKDGHPVYTFVYNEYNTKIETTDRINELMKYFGFNGYYNLIELKDDKGMSVPGFPDVSVLTTKSDYTYLIQLWFSKEQDHNKLRGVTVSKISKKES